jgi:broad specificity phosphatase PhoE
MAERVVLIRHGETDWSARGLHTGRTDVPLNGDGEVRARLLRPALEALPGIDGARVWTSPLSRARRTCELAGLGPRAEVVDELVEWDYGEYDGTRTVDIRVADPHWSIWTATIRAGETLADVGRRADRVIGYLDGEGGVVVIFAHAHILRILGARWCGLTADGGAHLTMEPASVSLLGWERETRAILQWNAPVAHAAPSPQARG